MADTSSVLEAIRATKPMDLVNHPFTFAVGVGAANGLLAAVRGKRVDLPTGIALAAILGVGEAVINHFEPHPPGAPPKRSDLSVAIHSVLGVALGLAPFVFLMRGAEDHGGGIPVAEAERARQEKVA